MNGTMDMAPSGNGRMIVALAVFGLLALLIWRTMDAGRYRDLAWLLIGFFAFRVVLARLKTR